MTIGRCELAGVDVPSGRAESEMTTPAERTRSVHGTRQFLEILAGHTGRFNHALVRTLAIRLLRHFPSDADIAHSSRSLPTIWGALHGGDSGPSMSESNESNNETLCPDAQHVRQVGDDAVSRRIVKRTDSDARS
ncbi:BPSL0761 family protein [Paraburkholderia youngii]|uniref:BPSL0761 family protein n=1 Tax=Paraburkholderia youngii TaxID=2782701 RepID=UPI0028A8F3BE|nr:BPSL0761 family protein [Paraburkholderia youngii]